jgi:hypothetical protein
MTLREERLAQRITLREYCLMHNLDIIQRSREERAEYPPEPIVNQLPAVVCNIIAPADDGLLDDLIKMLEAEESEVQKIRDAKKQEGN